MSVHEAVRAAEHVHRAALLLQEGQGKLDEATRLATEALGLGPCPAGVAAYAGAKAALKEAQRLRAEADDQKAIANGFVVTADYDSSELSEADSLRAAQRAALWWKEKRTHGN